MNRLTYIRNDEIKYKNMYCFYKCSCGIIKSINRNHVKNGHTKSCGCLHKENFNNKVHGMTGTRFRNIWATMKERCKNKNNNTTKNYGDKGIFCCKNWLRFEDFLKDMHKEYLEHSKKYGEKNTTLDRVNSKLGYSKENCKWETYKKQGRNKSNNVIYKGKCLSEWREKLGISKGRFDRLKYVKKLSLKKIFGF